MRPLHRIAILTTFVIFSSLAVAACGGSSDEAQPVSTPRVVATMPPARFTAVAEQVVATTPTAAVATPALLTPTADASISRGELVYTNKKCAECHGPQGEGVADKGNALASTELTFQKFEDILRTGGNGSLGNDHLYGPSAISPSGMTNLYAFVASLGK